MHKKLLTLTLGLLLTGCAVDDDYPWQLQQRSENATYQAELACAAAPAVGPFQDCVLRLQSQQPLPANLLIAVDGGMPAHGHGLPTAPQTTPTSHAGEYRIEGLKYSMPGAWVVGFLLHTETTQDKVIFKVNL